MTSTSTILDISLDCTERCFDLPEWQQLLETDPDRHIFATPRWAKLWWDEFRTGKDLFLLTMKRAGDVAAVVPLYRKTEGERRLLRFIGGIDLTDYLGPICSLEDRADVAETLVEWLLTTEVAWDEFDAHNMPVPFGFAEFLVESADRRGLDFKLDQEETAAVLMLPPDWDTYLEGLESKQRRELKRKRRRLGREMPDHRFRTTTSESLEADLRIFVDMHRGAEGHKGHFMKPEIATFFERVARSFDEVGWLRLDFLEIGDRAVASTFSFRADNSFYLYNSAYEPDAARLSPGLVLVSELVRESIEKGVTYFDFLRGPERYKYELGAQAVPLHNVRLMNPSSAS
ncbi:MAG TPA: GNAT family N-acetyltransferase [Actinomycetota bacterium]|nr:GNAT family N-acetyltransferase [Actinomycetota bacterium]